MYTFDNKVKLQSKGGPIGLELTGVLAQLFMVWWDRQFKTKMDENGLRMRMYKRYVDDVNVIINAPREGLKFIESEGKVIQDDSVAEQERAIKADRRCMALIQKIGNSIHSSIELEVDYPSQHEDGKLPILDLKVWVETRRQSGREEEDGVSVDIYKYTDKQEEKIEWKMTTTIKKGLRNVTGKKPPANKERRWDLKRPLNQSSICF